MTTQQVKQLRDRTNVSMALCKQALVATSGNIEKAIDWLRTAGALKASDVSNRSTAQGAVYAYVHPGSTLGAMVQVECETDFVAKSDDFIAFCKDVAMHVAASSPRFIQTQDASGTEWANQEFCILEAQVNADPKMANKHEDMKAKVLHGKFMKVVQAACLLEQPFVKDPTQTVRDLLSALVLKTGENIRVTRFERFDLKNKA